VSKDVFDESSKTLNSVVSQIINNTTSGITLSYDDNGNIQSSTIGPNGINLKGDKVDITVNKDFKVVTQNLNNKVGKD
ncbi:structural protein, partial [Staphylococcus epidermidis]